MSKDKTPFFTTKVLIEVTVDTGIRDAIWFVLDSLRFPAVSNVKVIEFETNEFSDSLDKFTKHPFKG